MGRLWRFPGGIHPPGRKEMSLEVPLARASLPPLLVQPVHQHIGQPAEPVVQPGERVLKGQVIAHAGGVVSVPIHAASSGTVVAVEPRPVPHPSGLSAPCIVIETDGEDRWAERPEPIADWAEADPARLRERVREAGIVGLGGAAFPTHVKLNPGQRHAVEYLILNGAECEPYITADDMLVREHADEIVGGMQILRRILDAGRCLIGIEDNKPEAIAAMEAAVARLGDPAVEVRPVPTRYPTGGEKQLIHVLTGRVVPSGGLPIDVGVVCQNLSTTAAVYRAVTRGEPLVSRIVTVTGEGVARPRNLEVALGTPVRHLVAEAGGYTPKAARLIMGGPMMGVALASDEVPVVKATNCVLVASEAEVAATGPALPCIRCGQCMNACPMRLLPQQLYWYARARDLDRAQALRLFDCIECGCCAYVCPSRIPLVQYFRYAKTEIWARERERRRAERARRRHEAKQERLERARREKAERMRMLREAAAAKKAEDGTRPAAGEPPKAVAVRERVRRHEEAGEE
ncbi:electron transport complex subunit RsxC [Inmirania thermothiophila]|uniref:Ion-translocating oxidoreductase complex subunit C n=1 Tax=Inmirania thermothiophila TaxID=1750597 RepID=A0A3N1Y8B5_9GAMM|nr:electron transport complex subunit RsxC [Inmirania thermothiophila]ROR35054.1 electron transport complex protein RnfC [Inmirania thermothiophila]